MGSGYVSVRRAETSPSKGPTGHDEHNETIRTGASAIGQDGSGDAQVDSLSEEDKRLRTVFLGNVSISAIDSKAARKQLLKHITLFDLRLNKAIVDTSLDTFRFRSTPFDNTGLPKKAAFAKKSLLDKTRRSTNAYAVYRSQAAAVAAAERFNGSMILDRHLRVDSLADPFTVDHVRCVFVGNLGFVDSDNSVNGDQLEGRRNSRNGVVPDSADYEEGLWRVFGDVGRVESVRLVRDKTTQVGKGFAYVQFRVSFSVPYQIDCEPYVRQEEKAVEKALLCNDKDFPPLLPRRLRVMRATKHSKSEFGPSKAHPRTAHKGDGSTMPPHKISGHANYARRTQRGVRKAPGGSKQTVFEGVRAREQRDRRFGIRNRKRMKRQIDRAANHRRRSKAAKV